MDRRTFLTATVGFVMAGRSAYGEEIVRMRDLYDKNLSFSDYAEGMEGERVAVEGFMAPPLKADASFFVLTKRPMAACPFCETDADWPDDILAIYTKRVINLVPFNVRIVTRGTLELGTFKDPKLGFVSRVRLVEATYERG